MYVLLFEHSNKISYKTLLFSLIWCFLSIKKYLDPAELMFKLLLTFITWPFKTLY